MTDKEKYELTRKSLEDLLSWATSDKRYKSANPYMILPIKNAMQTLTGIDGNHNYLDLPLHTHKYNSGELKI